MKFDNGVKIRDSAQNEYLERGNSEQIDVLIHSSVL